MLFRSNGSFRDVMLFSAGINLICTKHSYSYLHSLFFLFIIILIIKHYCTRVQVKQMLSLQERKLEQMEYRKFL